MLFLFLSAIFCESCGSTSKNNDNVSTLPDHGTITVDSAIVAYNVHGKGDTTLLFIHGWCIDQTYWSSQSEAFHRSYKVVTIDLPGFGQSESKRTNSTIEEYGEDVVAVINQLSLTNVVLIGHSMSGDVVLEAAQEHPAVIAVVGVDNFKEVGLEYNDELRAQIDGFISSLKQNFSQLAPAFAERALFHPSTDSLAITRVTRDFSDCHPVIGPSSLANLFMYGEKEATQLSTLKQPLFLINSDVSPTSEDGLKQTGVTFEVLTIHATGHYPMIEKPEEFNRLLKAALAKIRGSDKENH